MVSEWSSIIKLAANSLRENAVLVIECYHGVDFQSLASELHQLFDEGHIICANDYYRSEHEIDLIMQPDVTDDRIFGYRSRLTIEDLFQSSAVEIVTRKIYETKKPIVIYGTGASLLCPAPSLFVYVDLARWEIQMRMRRGDIGNLGVNNHDLEIARKYKRAYFVDWLICDRIKRKTAHQWDFVVDANDIQLPKMISRKTFEKALDKTISQPFRVVPFFDPGPWGGQWMREVCDLPDGPPNYAWCFDCVPEENSIQYVIQDITLEFPSINVVYFRPQQLLGAAVYSRFGAEFPIRFDFLDTMDGGNLSLQVHPLTGYIQEHFGMHYTQDESYYLLDAGDDAVVYLGLKENVEADKMLSDLNLAQASNTIFDADKYVAKWPAKKHDHFLIPAGTVHCSGKNSMVLEISATPYIFTFKLWDWGRLGLDGLPRPINIERGAHVIQWDRNKEWVQQNLINQFLHIESGDDWTAERTGLHETEFIETIRHTFSGSVSHHTNGNLNVLNLVEGDEVIIESPTDAFEPFHVHYAETFIVPANVGEYTIRPAGKEKLYMTMKAYVRS